MADDEGNTTPKGVKEEKDLAESLMNSVMGEMAQSRRKRLLGELKKLVEVREGHQTALSQSDLEIKKFMDNVRANVI